MSRRVKNLAWAFLSPKPLFQPKRLRGARARGLAYERKVGRHLEQLLAQGQLHGRLFSGQWLYFEDDGGPGHAQPDHFIVRPDSVLLLECKLTQTDLAWEQVEGLYSPLLKHLFNLPVVGVQVCRNLRRADSSLVHSPAGLRHGSTWHWIGG